MESKYEVIKEITGFIFSHGNLTFKNDGDKLIFLVHCIFVGNKFYQAKDDATSTMHPVLTNLTAWDDTRKWNESENLCVFGYSCLLEDGNHGTIRVECQVGNNEVAVDAFVVPESSNHFNVKIGIDRFVLAGHFQSEAHIMTHYKNVLELMHLIRGKIIYKCQLVFYSKRTLANEADDSVLRKCLLVKRLYKYMTYDDVKNYFKEFGEVINIYFIHHKTLRQTRACIVEMAYEETVKKILNQKQLLKGPFPLTAEKYRGMSFHNEVFDMGRYKLTEKDMGKNISKYIMQNNRCEEKVYFSFALLLKNISYVGIELHRNDDDGVLNGKLSIRLLNNDDMNAVKQIFSENFLDAPHKKHCSPLLVLKQLKLQG